MRDHLQKTISDIEGWLGVSLTIKDQAGVLVDADHNALFPGRVSHNNWFCPWRRAGNYQWRVNCMENCNHMIPRIAKSTGKPFVSSPCWKGLQEVIVPIFSDGDLAFIIFAGVFRPREVPKDPQDLFTNTDFLEKYLKLPITDDLICQQIMRILTTIGNGIMHEITDNSKREPGRLGIIQSFIENNYHKKVYLDDIARELHLSPSRASHFIKEETGQSFSKLILNERVKRVRNLLISSDMSLAEIASKTGFNNEYYLSRQFVSIIGTPPQKYRKQNIPEQG